jgi:hypothetical protein
MSRLKELIESSMAAVLQKFWDANKKEILPTLVDSFENQKMRQKLYNPVTNKRWSILMEERCRRAASTTYDFIDEHLMDIPYLYNKINKWRDIESTYIDGHVLEFGVFQGVTIRHLAKLFGERTIHGFDTFEGLPEDWNYTQKGTFDMKGELPEVPVNVVLYKGVFEDTLPEWVEEHQGDIAFLNIDCDLYSSTRTVLSLLKEQIVSGTVIHFDEMIGYYGWQNHEYKAFKEFIEETGRKFEYISYGPTYVLLRIL